MAFVLVFLTANAMSSTSLVSCFSPSLCNEGFIYDDSRGPLLLGSGFGSKPYHILYDRWTILKNTKTTLNLFSEEQANFARILLDRMRSCQECKMNEAVFSGLIASSLQQLMPTFDADRTQKSMAVLHQTCVPDGSSCAIDISIVDALKPQSRVHASLEVKWKFEEDKFPQSQGSAYVPLLVNSGACIHRWLPVFVLSKGHYQFGVAFDGINSRWAYSEICHFTCPNRAEFAPGSDDNVLSILQFAQFFIEAAIYHRDFRNDVPDPHLVDKFGEVIILHPSVVVGRVLHGYSVVGERIILKLYADLRSAQAALAKQEAIQKVLKYRNNAELKEGCDPMGMFAVLHKYCTSTPSITLDHVEQLALQVDKLHKEQFLHGDLRLPNIMFSEDDRTVTLIDFDWSGKFGEAAFPAGASPSAFGPIARNFVGPGKLIHPLFDWMCLADLLYTMEFYEAAMAASNALVNNVIAEIQAQRSERRINLFRLLCPGPPILNVQFDLRSLGLRFYFKRRSAYCREKPKAKSENPSIQGTGSSSGYSNLLGSGDAR
jgi:hypothetical protein